jgi:hypothetical protein
MCVYIKHMGSLLSCETHVCPKAARGKYLSCEVIKKSDFKLKPWQKRAVVRKGVHLKRGASHQ